MDDTSFSDNDSFQSAMNKYHKSTQNLNDFHILKNSLIKLDTLNVNMDYILHLKNTPTINDSLISICVKYNDYELIDSNLNTKFFQKQFISEINRNTYAKNIIECIIKQHPININPNLVKGMGQLFHNAFLECFYNTPSVFKFYNLIIPAKKVVFYDVNFTKKVFDKPGMVFKSICEGNSRWLYDECIHSKLPTNNVNNLDTCNKINTVTVQLLNCINAHISNPSRFITIETIDSFFNYFKDNIPGKKLMTILLYQIIINSIRFTNHSRYYDLSDTKHTVLGINHKLSLCQHIIACSVSNNLTDSLMTFTGINLLHTIADKQHTSKHSITVNLISQLCKSKIICNTLNHLGANLNVSEFNMISLNNINEEFNLVAPSNEIDHLPENEQNTLKAKLSMFTSLSDIIKVRLESQYDGHSLFNLVNKISPMDLFGYNDPFFKFTIDLIASAPTIDGIFENVIRSIKTKPGFFDQLKKTLDHFEISTIDNSTINNINNLNSHTYFEYNSNFDSLLQKKLMTMTEIELLEFVKTQKFKTKFKVVVKRDTKQIFSQRVMETYELLDNRLKTYNPSVMIDEEPQNDKNFCYIYNIIHYKKVKCDYCIITKINEKITPKIKKTSLLDIQPMKKRTKTDVLTTGDFKPFQIVYSDVCRIKFVLTNLHLLHHFHHTSEGFISTVYDITDSGFGCFYDNNFYNMFKNKDGYDINPFIVTIAQQTEQSMEALNNVFYNIQIRTTLEQNKKLERKLWKIRKGVVFDKTDIFSDINKLRSMASNVMGFNEVKSFLQKESVPIVQYYTDYLNLLQNGNVIEGGITNAMSENKDPSLSNNVSCIPMDCLPRLFNKCVYDYLPIEFMDSVKLDTQVNPDIIVNIPNANIKVKVLVDNITRGNFNIKHDYYTLNSNPTDLHPDLKIGDSLILINSVYVSNKSWSELMTIVDEQQINNTVELRFQRRSQSKQLKRKLPICQTVDPSQLSNIDSLNLEQRQYFGSDLIMESVMRKMKSLLAP